MSNGTRVVQRWKLNDIHSLQDLEVLLRCDYNKKEDDIRLSHRWVPSNGDAEVATAGFRISEHQLEDETFRYIPAFAKVYALRSRDIRAFLPQDHATIDRSDPVLFVNERGSIIALVSTSSSWFSRIRSNLMRLLQNKKNQWGQVDFSTVLLERPFFYWLISKKGQIFRFGNENYTLRDVTGFVSATERKRHTFLGKGSSIDGQPPVQTMVSLGTSFYELDLVFGGSAGSLVFSIREDFQTKIDFTRSNKVVDEKIHFYDPNDLTLRIYLQVIPDLILGFNKVADWDVKEKAYRKQTGIDAIRQIMAGTGLAIGDIST